ncbi:MAG: bifunctional oligoribonuclease/PAP phosphatase NrnA [Parcubacteria group bacterium]
MPKFAQDFNTLNFAIKESARILLFAHSRPDGDTIGSVLALRAYAESLGKDVAVACFDPFPDYLKNVAHVDFSTPDQLDLKKYNLIIAADSVERGFEKIKNDFQENQVVALIDHHPDITIRADINIIDATYSSVCEIIYDFFESVPVKITRDMATYLLLGILSDTGMFQHSNTTPRVMSIASALMKAGAPMAKIVQTSFANKNIATLRLWGKAFEKARINPKNGMIASVLTQKDLEECGASTEDIARVSEILNTVPGTKFALILSERGDGTIKGSLRSEEYKGVDVSAIAAQLGGGGHRLASGFEIKGTIKETEDGWEIV